MLIMHIKISDIKLPDIFMIWKKIKKVLSDIVIYFSAIIIHVLFKNIIRQIFQKT